MHCNTVGNQHPLSIITICVHLLTPVFKANDIIAALHR
jgi:hypothetical protein